MEVSSHGLEQGRVNGVRIRGALFTNLSRDHLDYHGSMDDYLAAKIKLFARPELEFAVLNMDDPRAERILNRIADAVTVWGFTQQAVELAIDERVYAKNIVEGLDGIRMDVVWREAEVSLHSGIVGLYNVENILAVLTVLLAMDMSLEQAVDRLAGLKPVAGRMENFGGHGRPSVFVDYAHSPDALEKVLAGLKPHCRGRLRVVFGCGGERDRGKRTQMGAVAEKWADDMVLTDDNPRTEPPEQIIANILKGCRGDKKVVHDRKQAIHEVIASAGRQDCVVVAGKGHEHYQEINGIRQPFSDQRVVEQALAEWHEEQ
nr:UDP-N-acetylmuramoyl-L-alanyl-D-glutamate--2,6-diaminopimelate ligase [Methylomarinum sp. Ch1-1]MDP4522172.1 UDP-N-acetylmuramoyl-L-alanyl-D-glutamate--2,6-diaminopimelate ligase [Methylomarinum sp. Ch1-1]